MCKRGEDRDLLRAPGAGELLRLVVVAGPTASGKSELAVRIAEQVGGEIINADSMQFYSGMEIGTARPARELMARVPHHLFGVVTPDINYTAAAFIADARRVIADIAGRGRVPVVVGGTGLYIRALLCGLAASPPSDEEYRQGLVDFAEQHGNQALHARLLEIDPEAAARLHSNDRLRVIRALEVYHQTGRPFSLYQLDHGFNEEWCRAFKIGIDVERSLLYARIEERVDMMVAAGLLAEVKGLIDKGYSPALKSMGAIGYKEMCGHLAGRYTLAEAVSLIKRNTRRYAKRQVTWFKADPEIYWVDYPAEFANICKVITDFLKTGEVYDQGAVQYPGSVSEPVAQRTDQG